MCIHFRVILIITENLAFYPNNTVTVHEHWAGVEYQNSSRLFAQT